MSASTAVIDAAHALIAQGYAIVAVGTHKNPLRKGWREERQKPNDVLADLSRPGCVAIGFPGGDLNHNIVPLDFDTPDAEKWWEHQCREAGIDPNDFPTVVTPGKIPLVDGQPHPERRRAGSHRYVHDVRGLLTNAEGELGALGINIRGRGHAMLPPSPHPDGGTYQWVQGHSLDDFPDGIPACPAFVYGAIAAGAKPAAPPPGANGNGHAPPSDTTYKYCRAALNNARQRLAHAPEKHRNQTLNNEALALGHLAHHGAYTEAEVLAALSAAAETCGLMQDDGPAQVEATFKSGWKAGLAAPEDIPPRERQRGDNGAATGADGSDAGNSGSTHPDDAVPIDLSDFVAYLPQHSYIFRPTGEIWAAASINARIAPVIIGDKQISATAWLDKNFAVEQMSWLPGEPELVRDRLIKEGGWIERKDATVFNLYRPPTITPKRGDITPWLNHVGAVYPGVAEHITQWLAKRVQRPEVKINHALVLGGDQGIGKDTILEPVKHAIGPWNFQEANPAQVLGRFNPHLKAVILRISEARDLGEINRFAFYDHLKAIIASPPDTLRIDDKNIREYVVPNLVGVILTTNHKTGGIHLPPDDRRHFVAWSDVPEGHFPAEYFTRLYRWFDHGGNEIVADYLLNLDTLDFDPKAPPPKTEAFWQMVNSGRAPENAELADILDLLGNPDAVTLTDLKMRAPDDLQMWFADRKNSRAIPHRLEDVGYEAVQNPDAKDGHWVIAKRRQVVYAKRELSHQGRLLAARRLRDGAP